MLYNIILISHIFIIFILDINILFWYKIIFMINIINILLIVYYINYNKYKTILL